MGLRPLTFFIFEKDLDHRLIFEEGILYFYDASLNPKLDA
jgi:hypothetical protein